MSKRDIPAGYLPLIPEARDLRRAAVAILHANPERYNVDGLGAIVAEVKGDRRITEFITAAAVVAHKLPAAAGTVAGQAALEQFVRHWSAMEAANENKENNPDE